MEVKNEDLQPDDATIIPAQVPEEEDGPKDGVKKINPPDNVEEKEKKVPPIQVNNTTNDEEEIINRVDNIIDKLLSVKG